MGRFNPKLAQWVNSNLSFRDEYKAIFGKELDYGTCYCPFHANTDTKAAKLYGNWLKCYGECQQSYSVYDLLCKFNPDRLRELRYSGVLPEQGVVFRNDVKPVVFSYASASDIPSDLVPGSFEFYIFISDFQ